MSYLKVIDNIKNGNIENVNILYGDEIYLIDEVINMVKKQLINEIFRDMNLLILDKIDNSIDNLKNFIDTIPFMSDKKVAVVKDAYFLVSKKNLKKEEEKILFEIIEGKNNESVVFLILKNNKPDMRTKLVKKLKEKGSVYEINKLDESKLIKWIISFVKKHNIEISNRNASVVANLSGYLEYESDIDLYHIRNELNKLCSYCTNKGKIDEMDIEKLLIKSNESSIFKLVDFICEKKKEKSIIILKEMIANNVSEQYIIHMIIRQYRMLMQYSLLQKKGVNYNDIMKKMKIRKFVAYKLSNIIKNVSIEKLNDFLDKCIKIDRKIKSGQLDKTMGLEILINEA